MRRSLLMLHAMHTRSFIIVHAVVSASFATLLVARWSLSAGAQSRLRARHPRLEPAPLAPPPVVPREFRAAWVTPIYDRGFRDWPSSPALSPDAQRAELIALLDDAAAIGLNAVILHVRLAGDAFYPTKYAPWSPLLSGQSGVGPSPSYDPLAFAVAGGARARASAARVVQSRSAPCCRAVPGRPASTHVTRQHPDWVVKYGTQTWIDPGNPAARKYVLETILDVARRYDVDGIHLDDYFYPYRESRDATRVA